MDDGPQILPLPPPTLEPISRPSSTSTSASLPQLPGISSLASGSPATGSPQLRATNVPPPTFAGSAPAATSGGSGPNLPQCMNCQTSTTPLWRRDEYGSVLCNACGLFLKLHNRPRPISLKTDVIKSRNRVKTMRPDLASKKKQQQQQAQNYVPSDPNGVYAANPDLSSAARRQSQKSSNGHADGSHSPVSRTGTPGGYGGQLPVYHGLDDAQFQTSGIAGFTAGTSPGGTTAPLNGDRHLDAPQTHEQLIAANSSLKTRVSELEVINDLFRNRVAELEQEEANARRGQEVSSQAERLLRTQLETSKQTEASLRSQLEDSHRRENNLKRRLDELELELKEAKETITSTDSDRHTKRQRMTEMLEESEVSTPQSSI